MNRISIIPLYDAALHHLRHWITNGTPPPKQPLIEFAGDPGEVVRDQHGIAIGGVRLPQADVPIAQNSAIPLSGDIFALLRGSSVPFEKSTVDALYSDEAEYLAQFESAARRSVETGAILERDVAPLVEEAKREYRNLQTKAE